MKEKEMIGGASALTWERVATMVAESAPHGLANHEIAEKVKAQYDRVASLTKLMYEAGELSRVQTGRTGGTTLYFLPV